MTIQNQSSVSVRSCQSDLYANVGREVCTKIQFHCTTKGELQPWRKSKKENRLRKGRETTTRHSFQIGDRSCDIWTRCAVKTAIFLFANADCESKTIGIGLAFACISNSLTSIVLTTVCWFSIYFFLIFYLGSWRLPIAVSWSAAHHQSVIHHFDGFFAFCVTFVFACLHVVPPWGKVTRISVIESFILTERSLGNFCMRFGKGYVSCWEAKFQTP